MKAFQLRVLGALLLLIATSAASQGYPARPIEVVVGYGPGGGSDLSIRLIEAGASKILGQKIVVTNRPGAGGILAFNQFVRSAPDGYTLAIGTTATLTVQPHVDPAAVLYKPGDYVPIVQISSIPNLLVVPPDSPIKSFKEFVEFARKQPAGRVKVGGTSVGAMTHLPYVQLEKLYGVKFTFIPHKSSAGVVTAVMGGHIDAGCSDLPAVAAQIRGGSVRALGVLAPQRLAGLPNVPTLKEQGADVEAGFYNMLFAPKGTPEPVVATLRDAFRKALSDPQVVERAAKADMPIEYLDGQASSARLARNYETHGLLLKELGLSKQ